MPSALQRTRDGRHGSQPCASTIGPAFPTLPTRACSSPHRRPGRVAGRSTASGAARHSTGSHRLSRRAPLLAAPRSCTHTLAGLRRGHLRSPTVSISLSACTFHASDVTTFPERPPVPGGVSTTYAEVFDRLDHAFAVSEFVASALQEIGWRGRTDILPAGVPLDLFPQRPSAPRADPVRILYVGRVVTRKGLDVLLRALAELRPDDAAVTLDVIGDGPQLREYEALARRVVPDRTVRFLGAAGRPEVLAALRRAHVLVVPSRTMPSGEVEGSPVVVKEALAVGVPVVATRSGGLPEVVPPRYRDELVPEDDPVALAGRLSAVLEDPDAWPERAHVGRAWVEEQFDWAVLGQRTVAMYSRLAANGTRRAPPA